MAIRARGLTERDEAEWARFADRITPLKGRRRTVALPETSPEPQPPKETQAAVPGPAAMRGFHPRREPIGIGGRPAGVDTATWQRFHRGQLDGVRKIDLHGMTAQHAFTALRGFLRAAHAERVRCVEIVTGRGDGEAGGVLRRELPHWLNLPEIRPMLLAAAHPRISSAMHSHIANAGSVRLLLRRSRA